MGGGTLGHVARRRVGQGIRRRVTSGCRGRFVDPSFCLRGRLFELCSGTLTGLPIRFQRTCRLGEGCRLARGRVTLGLGISPRAIGCQVNRTLGVLHMRLGSCLPFLVFVCCVQSLWDGEWGGKSCLCRFFHGRSAIDPVCFSAAYGERVEGCGCLPKTLVFEWCEVGLFF